MKHTHLQATELVDINGMCLVKFPSCMFLTEYDNLDVDLPMTDDIFHVTCPKCLGRSE